MSVIAAGAGDSARRGVPRATLEALAAVAFAHLRRLGSPDPAATRLPAGWRCGVG
ncbi:MAG: hypothetical protein ACK6AD_15525 [Cyanobacteriota bacterium]